MPRKMTAKTRKAKPRKKSKDMVLSFNYNKDDVSVAKCLVTVYKTKEIGHYWAEITVNSNGKLFVEVEEDYEE